MRKLLKMVGDMKQPASPEIAATGSEDKQGMKTTSSNSHAKNILKGIQDLGDDGDFEETEKVNDLFNTLNIDNALSAEMQDILYD